MDFTSINEYFYKFSSRLMVILLLPIAIFTFLYVSAYNSSSSLGIDLHRAIITTVLAVLWILSFFLFNKKIKSIRSGQGLRWKLENYFGVTIVRYMIFSFCSLMLSAAYYLTGDDFFTACFVAQLILCGILWPRSTKVSNDLKLRGDEREMVYYKKDTL